jgi:hypothetical protein
MSAIVSAVLHVILEYDANAAVAQQTPSISANGGNWFSLGQSIWTPGLPISTPFGRTEFHIDLETLEPAMRWGANWFLVFDLFQGVANPNQVADYLVYDTWVVVTDTTGTAVTYRPTKSDIVGNASTPLDGIPGVDAHNYVLNPDNAIDGDPATFATIHRDPVSGPMTDWPSLKLSAFAAPFTPPPPPPPPPQAWLVIDEPVIGMTDRTPYLHMGDSQQNSFSQQLRQRGQATIHLFIAAGDRYVPTRGAPVYLWDQTDDTTFFLVFAGLIQDIENDWTGHNAGDRFVLLTAVSLESVFDTVYASPVQYFEQTAGFIVTDLFNRFETGCPVTLGAIGDGAIIPLFNTNYEKLSEIFTQLATTSQYTWYVDPSTRQLVFDVPSVAPAPAPFAPLTDQPILWDSITWKVNGADYRNRQAIRLSMDAFAHSGEFFVGAGQQTFTLMRPVEQVTNAYATLSTPNTATGTFAGQPAPGDTITIGTPVGTWLPTHVYALGGTIIDSAGHVQKITGGTLPGLSGPGPAPPIWDDKGGTTIDGAVIWTDQGLSGLSNGTDTYTFVTDLDNTLFGQVLIDQTAADTCTNLVSAINATRTFNGTQIAGVTYSLPTWECALCNAVNLSGTHFTLQEKAAGTGWIAALSTTSSAFSWSSPVTTGGTSPQGSLGPGEGATISLQVYVQGTSVASPGLAYTPGSAVITLATPLNVGSNLNVEYTRAGGDVIEVEDTALVNAFAEITHGTGKVQQITDASSTGLIKTSAASGLQFAQEALKSFKVAPTALELKTFTPGLQAGMALPVDLLYPIGGRDLLNGDWVIEEIDAEMVPVSKWIGNGQGHYRYTIKAVDIQEIGSFLDFWEGLGGGGGSAGGGASGGLVATSGGTQTVTPGQQGIWYEQEPAGTRNGVNRDFYLDFVPTTAPTGTPPEVPFILLVNGIEQDPYFPRYTLAGKSNHIVMAVAPESTDEFSAAYWAGDKATIPIDTSDGFTISATPASRTINATDTTTYTVSIGFLAGFAGTVALVVSGLPVGATGTFSPPSRTSAGTSTLTVVTSSGTPDATSLLTVSASSGATSHTTVLVLTVGIPVVASVADVVFPSGSGVVDVTAHGAAGNGTTDDTAAIQAAIYYALAHQLNVIYFPAGTYLISDTLVWKDAGATWRAYIAFWGQNESTTTIKLANSASGFGNATGSPLYDLAAINAKAMIYTASEAETNPLGAGEAGYYNDIHDLTLDTGTGNPGAEAIDWVCSNMASIRNVTIKGSGRVALNASRGWGGGGNGPALVKNLTISGTFDYGIINGAGEVGITWEHINISSSPNLIGLWNSNQNTWVRDLKVTTSAAAQAVLNEGVGNMVLIDSAFTGASPGGSAVLNNAFLFARNITSSGYFSAIARVGGTNITEYSSLGYVPLFLPAATTSLNLPILETPAFLADNDFTHWAVVTAGGGDRTTDIQTALNAGKPIVFLQAGAYTISGNLTVPTGVRRICGLYSQLNTAGSHTITFAGTSGASIDFRSLAFLGDISLVNHATVPLVVADVFNPSGYGNGSGTGLVVFFENAAIPGTITQSGGQAWARQFDIESDNTKVVNIGADFWCLGYKTEGTGAGGTGLGLWSTESGGRTEILGAFNSTPGPGSYLGYFETDSQSSIAGLSSGSVRVTVITETRAGVSKSYLNAGNRLGGAAVTLYSGRP